MNPEEKEVLAWISTGARPQPYIDYAQWAERNFYLPKASTKEHGLIRLSRTPMLREPLRELSPQSPTQNVDVVKPTQLGGTTLGMIFVCGVIDAAPGPILFIGPTDTLVRSFSKKRLAKTIAVSPRLRKKVADPKSRTSGNEILRKEFSGGDIRLAGSNSQAVYRSEPARYVLLDDFAGFPVDVDGEGSPDQLAERRTGTFSNCKIYVNSTPTEKDTCNMRVIWEKGSQGFFNVPCPRCGKYQYLEWGGPGKDHGIKFERNDRGDITKVWYQCICCGFHIDESEKPWMLENGAYIHRYPDRERRGFRYNEFYAPHGWRYTWKRIAEEFLDAARAMKEGNMAPMKAVVNTLFAEWWEEPGEKVDWKELKRRAGKQITDIISGRIQFLTAGVDTQDDRLAVSIVGWGERSESWVIFHDELQGDPNYGDVWRKLDDVIMRRWHTEDGRVLTVVSGGVDTGGHRTQAVYSYCMARMPTMIALKGATSPIAPILSAPTKQNVDFAGEKIDEGAYLWHCGTYSIKGLLDSKLKLDGSGPGRIHFSSTFPDEYYKQLTGEKLKTDIDNTGHKKQMWVQVRRAIEARVCWCYAYAAASRIDIAMVSTVEQAPDPPRASQVRALDAPAGWFDGMDMEIDGDDWMSM